MARNYEVNVEPVNSADANRWKWTLVVDGKELDFGEVTGGRDKARFAGVAAHNRYLGKIAGKKQPLRERLRKSK